jgi:hypothetical protein
MFRRLPPEMGAGLVMFGDGKLRERLIERAACPSRCPALSMIAISGPRAGLLRYVCLGHGG